MAAVMGDSVARAIAAANDGAVAIDVRITNLTRSFNAFKGSLTNRINGATRAIAFEAGQAMSDYKMRNLEECADKIRDSMEKISDIALVLMQLDAADGQQEHWQGELDGEQIRADRAMGQVLAELARGRAERARAQAQVQAAQPPPPQQQGGDKPKAISDLRPNTLTLQATPAELTAWIKDFRTYFRASHFDQADLETQQGHFRRCLHHKLQLRVVPQVADNTPVLEDGLPAGIDSCVSILREAFLEYYPLFTRRLRFFQCVQPPNTPWTTFSRQLQRLGREADLSNLTVDQTYCMRYLCATSNPDLLDEFFKLEDVSKEAIEECAIKYEAKEKAKLSLEKAGRGVAKVNATGNHKPESKKKEEAAKERQAVRGAVRRDLLQKRLCFRCAEPGHKGAECESIGPDFVCKSCGNKGHSPKACARAKISKQSKKKTSTPRDGRKKTAYKKKKAQVQRADADSSSCSYGDSEETSEGDSDAEDDDVDDGVGSDFNEPLLF